MRLLNTTTFQLTDFVGKAPPYAILSHTWGEEEVLFADISNPSVPKVGWAKVLNSCYLARSLGYTWIWINTCCIDKSSSAELSEAINSMFRFCQNAVICIAYLSDVPYPSSEGEIPKVLAETRWFTRGWTLQELLAPKHLDFYSSDWKLLGSRSFNSGSARDPLPSTVPSGSMKATTKSWEKRYLWDPPTSAFLLSRR
ncbi:ankyrin repeat-containing protein [Colletotrichum asianum]|uniref:Ankyrin repeat-containing protein n=1 Tax=Colletotrichum asianum TaxID=702518 RepID=A0A8H3WQF7_9PEZI|nr:ankyrin repeat-containing protein [Colletotrichum asianum]